MATLDTPAESTGLLTWRAAVVAITTWPPLRSRRLFPVGGVGATISQPGREQVAARVRSGGRVEDRPAVRIGGRRADVGAGSQEPLSGPPLTAVARLPERPVQLLGGRRAHGE